MNNFIILHLNYVNVHNKNHYIMVANAQNVLLQNFIHISIAIVFPVNQGKFIIKLLNNVNVLMIKLSLIV